jgi:lipopolysaccharide/colanic/teichoic acid biosynthesis glycosyltransferase
MGVEGRIETTLGRAAAQPLPSEHDIISGEPHLFYNACKRAADLILAALLFLVTLPIVVLAAFAIVLTTRRSPVLAQRRIGLRGRPFTMLKLRTMRDAAPGSSFGPKQAADPRITAVGIVLRRTSIDELPQLLNVLAGQMSLVGPRPALPGEVELYQPGWRRRLDVMPGLTGLWQVSGRSALSLDRWMALDRCYLRRRSLLFDAAILARTVGAVITMRGAW